MEIRLYFECLEQAHHYILPRIKEGVREANDSVDIVLVRRPRSIKERSKSAMCSIYALTTPDFLITLCANNEEIPLIIGEFSEAVVTEDHELQRSMGAIAATLSDCIYLKISGEKESPADHGGGELDPMIVAKTFREVFDYYGYIIAKWPTIEGNSYILERNPIYLSCPPNGVLPLAEKTIPIVVETAIKNVENILKDGNLASTVISALRKLEEFEEYEENLRKVVGIEKLKNMWKDRTNRYDVSTRVYYKDDTLIVKVNRFSHAADPDRGILIFTSSVLDVDKTLARYQVKGEIYDREKLLVKFFEQADEEGIPEYFLKGLKKNLPKDTPEEIDITEFLRDMQSNWENNKVLSSIMFFSDGLLVHNNRQTIKTLFKWDRSELMPKEDGEKLIETLKKMWGSKRFEEPLWIRKANMLTEDEVTYVVVHDILRPNGFEIVSTSYPGAQGDVAILPQARSGRKQPRIFVDAIAWLPRKQGAPSLDIALEESKGKPYKSALIQAQNKLLLFKEKHSHQEALKETLTKLRHDRSLRKMYIGIGFGTEKFVRTSWEPTKVDFIVRIVGRDRWDVAFFGDELRDVFKLMSGKLSLPEVWEVSEKPKFRSLNYYQEN